jgi:hypothetical protein
MVRHRSVALPSLFPRPWSRRRDLTGRPLSSAVLPPPDLFASPYLSRLGWPLHFRWGIKGKPSRGVAIAKSRQISSSTVSSLLFSLRLDLSNLPLAHLCRCSAHPPIKLFRRLRQQPPEAARKKIERRAPACIADHASVRGHARVPPLDACSDVPLHRRWSLSSFSFPCTHSSSTSPWTALRQWAEHHVSFALSEFSLPRSVSEHIFHLCNFCLVGRHCSNPCRISGRDSV